MRSLTSFIAWTLSWVTLLLLVLLISGCTGSPPGKRMYRYTYTEDDLKELYEKCLNMNFSEVYVLFNNDTMYEDTLRFMKMVSGESPSRKID